MIRFWNTVQFLALDHAEQDMHELCQRELVQEMNRRQTVKGEEDPRSHVRNWNVVLRHSLNLFHRVIGLSDFLGNFSGFLLQSFQGLDQLIVLENVSFGCVELVEQLVFKVSEFHAEFTLQLDNVIPLLVYLGSLFFQQDLQALVLQTRGCHREVDEGHTRAQIWREECI